LSTNARIPVNLVTGFLGVGKTTAIGHLLEQRPDGQRWAVLVNEFGEVGVDGHLLDAADVVVQEVAGGCLCCVAAPLFTTGLNRLIRQHRPDRILIEPSGLGHPAQVLDTLRGPLYAKVVEIRATLCLMDARHLASPAHRAHPNFLDQIHLADVLVANKRDLYEPGDLAAFERFAADLRPPKATLACVAEGHVDGAWLDVSVGSTRRAAFPEAHAFLVDAGMDTAEPAASDDWLIIDGHADDYHHVGWNVVQGVPWPLSALQALLADLAVERMKGIVLTDKGWRTFNDGRWQPVTPPDDGRSRIQLIDRCKPARGDMDRRLRDLDDRPDGDAHQRR